MSRSSPRRLLAAALVAAVSAALLPTPSSAAAPSLAWAPCAEEDLAGYQCATREVPLDYDKPRGATTTIALARRPADDPARRLGTIFVNPGGPGGPGRGLVTAAAEIVAPEVRARFDLVGFDPRGIGASDPLQCFATDAEAEALIARIALVPITKQQIRDTLQANYRYTEACKRNAGPLLAHMSTLNVAKDLDQLRAAVGDAKLSYIGYSYGTLIGATYVNLYPNRVRAVILDGNVDPAQRTNRRLANKFDRAGGFEIALKGFLAACDRAGPNCALAGHARRKFDAVRERLRRGPFTSPTFGVVDLDLFTSYVYSSMYDVASFPTTAADLRTLHDELFGSPPAATVKRALPAGLSPRAPSDYSFNSNDAGQAVNCLDAPLPRNPAAYPAIADRFESAHRTFGRAEAFSEVGCANWIRTNERYAGPWNKRTSQTVLLVNPTHDPATRYSFAQNMARELGNARLLALDGFGHTSSFSACVTTWYTRYLLAGQVPPRGTRCAQDLPPFPAP
ncbi:alpha/beta fold hydrolase [Symbioplanes lichenis]|uniref:alpha/beta fold hydrolase n=1 Tax=Symbioplanes lichenis TaxID=1629072 RepID=UPI00273825C7|nr:alpha/beta fold hydrolase [Actinoplanes lichenis]